MLCLEACFVLSSLFTVPVNVTLLQVPLSQQTLPTGVLQEGQEVRIRLWGPQRSQVALAFPRAGTWEGCSWARLVGSLFWEMC